MAPINCIHITELKYHNKPINVYQKVDSSEIWISFDDITNVLSHGKNTDLLDEWKKSDKIKRIIANSEALSAISYASLFKLLSDVKASDAFCEWIAKHILDAMSSVASNKLNDQIDELKAELDKWRNHKQDTVYILNFYPYDDGIYKIGLTDKIERRVADLNTGTPAEIIVEYKRDCGNKRVIEQIMHFILEKYRVNPNKEFFRIPKYIAISLLDNVVDYVDGLNQLLSNAATFDREKNEFTDLLDEFKAVSSDKIYKVVKPEPPVERPPPSKKQHRWGLW